MKRYSRDTPDTKRHEYINIYFIYATYVYVCV